MGALTRSRCRLAIVACLAGWVLAVPLSSEAPAATATGTDSFRYEADPGERNEIVGTTSGDFRFADKGAREIRINDRQTPPFCRLVGDREVACRFRSNEDEFLPKDEYIDAGDGDDRLELELAARSGTDFNGGCRVDLGAGRDTLILRASRPQYPGGTAVGCFATVLAADGEADVIDCGGTPLGSFRGPRNGGSLRIEADSEDRFVNCAPPLPPEPRFMPGPSCVPLYPPGTIPIPGFGPSCPGDTPGPGLSGQPTQRRGTVVRHGLTVECSLGEQGDCLAAASISRRTARALGLRVAPRGPRIQVGAVRVAFPEPEGGRRTLSIRLARSVRRGLARHRRTRPRVLVTAVAHNSLNHEARKQISVTIGR